MKAQDLAPGQKFQLPGSQRVYRVVTKPAPYPYGQVGDVVIRVRFQEAEGEEVEDEIAFQARVPVQVLL